MGKSQWPPINYWQEHPVPFKLVYMNICNWFKGIPRYLVGVHIICFFICFIIYVYNIYTHICIYQLYIILSMGHVKNHFTLPLSLISISWVSWRRIMSLACGEIGFSFTPMADNRLGQMLYLGFRYVWYLPEGFSRIDLVKCTRCERYVSYFNLRKQRKTEMISIWWNNALLLR